MKKVHTALSRLKAKHGLNHHPLTFADFNRVCDAEAIELMILDIRVGGFFFRRADGGKFIALSQKLAPARMLFVAFHELGHYLMHKPDKVPPETDWKEREANLFAALATGEDGHPA